MRRLYLIEGVLIQAHVWPGEIADQRNERLRLQQVQGKAIVLERALLPIMPRRRAIEGEDSLDALVRKQPCKYMRTQSSSGPSKQNNDIRNLALSSALELRQVQGVFMNQLFDERAILHLESIGCRGRIDKTYDGDRKLVNGWIDEDEILRNLCGGCLGS